MNEPRFIDANKIDFRLNFLSDQDGDIYLALPDIKRAIAQTPTEDVVKVVRCKNCKYAQEYIKWNRQKYIGCELRAGEIVEVSSTHYCGYGEEKGEQNETQQV